MNKVMIFYALLPEETRLYLVDTDDADLEKLVLCNGHLSNDISNSDEVDQALNWLWEHLDSDWKGCEWDKSKVLTLDGSQVTVILTGFYL